MPEIGSGSCPGFPATLDTDAVKETAADFVRLNWGLDVSGCIAAIEAAIGTSPAGSYATVAARLDSVCKSTGGVPQGLAAARPAAGSGTLYWSYDQGTLEFSDGANWHAILTG